MISPRHTLLVGFMALVAMASVGCCPKLNPYKVSVSADDSVKDTAVAVHIVGVNPKDYSQWEAYSMSKYWAPADSFHTSATVYSKIVFDGTQPTTQVLDIPDEIWKKWLSEGDTHLFILANLPGFHEDHAGNSDARRQIIDIDNCAYEGELSGREVKILITKERIRVLTPLKAQK